MFILQLCYGFVCYSCYEASRSHLSIFLLDLHFCVLFSVPAAARRKDKKLREKDLSAHELGYAYSVHTDQPATDWTRSVSQNILINRLKKGPER